LVGDALTVLKVLPTNTFHVAVTSPPYYWARDYEVADQIGHEGTVAEYVTRLADVFDEVKRVLHPKGVFYLNLGDTYYSGNGQPHGRDPRCASRNFMRVKLRPVDRSGWDIPQKSLIGIPWRVAFELQRRGWTLRSDIVWYRQNSFAEPSVRDRPHRTHEHIFQLTKSRFYSYDLKALEGCGDVWSMPIERSKFIAHNAPYPRELVRRCIQSASPRGGVVLDPFVGSGTTLVTALELQRNSVGIDLKSDYIVDVTEKLTKRGCTRESWSDMETCLATARGAGQEWRGALHNMPKPGRKLRPKRGSV
jgi:site-specific DNA-methyltransferase (adenine-specific)